ncbi:MAG: AAA family ATPase [Bacteroidales bacterium]|nr:AAA family ATPase [Bacteroidales bacterium]
MEKLTIENFRSFKESAEIDLARINIITGPNNSGKSNILKMLLLFDDYINSRNHFSFLFNGYNTGKHKIDSYQNAVNWSNWKSDKIIRFAIVVESNELKFEFIPGAEVAGRRRAGNEKEGRLYRFEFISSHGNKLSLEYKKGNEYLLTVDRFLINELWIKWDLPELEYRDLASDLETRQADQLKRISGMIKRVNEIDSGSPEYIKRIIRIASYTNGYRLNQAKLEKIKQEVKNEPKKQTIKTSVIVTPDGSGSMQLPELISEGLRDYISEDPSKNNMMLDGDTLKQELRNINRIIKRYFKFRLAHLDPDRSDQSRIHLYSEKLTEINRLVHYQKARPFLKNSEADKFLMKWMRALNIGTSYRLVNLEGIAWAIEIKGRYGWRNIVDKGFGAGQIFSLLMRIAEVIERASLSLSIESRQLPFIVAIEEPEANLHPKFQSVLADIFMDAVGSANVQFVIETHSEYFIRRFQYLVADKRKNLSSTDIKILYFRESDPKQPGAELVYDLGMRPDGILKRDFGTGFFDEATKLTVDLLKQQKKN